MNELLNIAPLLCAIVGILLFIFLLFNKNVLGGNKKLKIILCVIVLIFEHNILDSYFVMKGYESHALVGYSYLYYHLIGALFLFFTYSLLKIDIRLSSWIIFLSFYTFFRFLLLIFSMILYESSNPDDTEFADLLSAIDYMLAILINTCLLVLSYIKAKTVNFAVKLDSTQILHYKWLKAIILLNIVLYFGIFLNSILMILNEDEFIFYFKLDSIISGLFFFILIYTAMRFPVFSVAGDYHDFIKKESDEEKYASSAISSEQSKTLFFQIKSILESEKPFLNFNYKLNDLSKTLNTPLHQISRAINENAGKSFSDFVNEYRVNEAKQMLISSKTMSNTIYAISLDVGFNSKTTFYSAFKKITGETPTQFKSKNTK